MNSAGFDVKGRPCPRCEAGRVYGRFDECCPSCHARAFLNLSRHEPSIPVYALCSCVRGEEADLDCDLCGGSSLVRVPSVPPGARDQDPAASGNRPGRRGPWED